MVACVRKLQQTIPEVAIEPMSHMNLLLITCPDSSDPEALSKRIRESCDRVESVLKDFAASPLPPFPRGELNRGWR